MVDGYIGGVLEDAIKLNILADELEYVSLSVV